MNLTPALPAAIKSPLSHDNNTECFDSANASISESPGCRLECRFSSIIA